MFFNQNEMEIHTARQPAVAIFNRLSGAFLTVSSLPFEQFNHDDPNAIAIQVEFDFTRDEMEGGLTIHEDGSYTANFKVIDRDEMTPTVYERTLDAQMSAKITKEYPVVEQVNIIGRAVKAIADQCGVEVKELDELLSYIKLAKDTSRVHKEFYRDSPDHVYISHEDFAEAEANRLAGGMHERLGPRPNNGGRVFGYDS